VYKKSKWANEIISLQHKDGSWGYFHSLSEPYKYPLTTEQPLRRLYFLGYTIEDEVIQRAVQYMGDCLIGKLQIPDRREKLHDWDVFVDMMLSTWIRKFTNLNTQANETAETWASIISSAFAPKTYCHEEYIRAYTDTFGIKPRGNRIFDFVSLYQVSLIAENLNAIIEDVVFDYILNYAGGIYYIYDRPLNVLPSVFKSKKASRYIGAIEILTAYKNNLHKLKFVSEWLMDNRNENGNWDMSAAAKDGIYFPLSDSWRRVGVREMDCTYRVQKLIESLDAVK
jgi:hypothetical protein